MRRDSAVLLEAAKRELEWQEKERPKRESLELIEGELRCTNACSSHFPRMREAADILKALREVVIPILRRHVQWDVVGVKQLFAADIEDFEKMLRALGEEP